MAGSSVDVSSPSPAATLVHGQARPTLPNWQRYALLILFCFAQFLDAFSNTAVFSALPKLKEQMDMDEGESTWVVSAFQLTFSSLLLISGRFADIYNPKFVFTAGLVGLGALSLGTGFLTTKIPLIVLRAFAGIFCAFTIPSALTLIVMVFPEPDEQARAIAAFGGIGAIGLVLGLVIGAFFTQWATWSWVFWFCAIIAFLCAIIGMLVIPTRIGHREATPGRWRMLDLGGVSILTASLILFIFGVTSGATAGWGSAEVLAPLIISIFGVVGFFLYERVLPEERAAVPPRTWFYPNFTVLILVSWLPIFWYATTFTIFTLYWQQVWGWSPIIAAVHMIPAGVCSFLVSFTGRFVEKIPRKLLILFGLVLIMIAQILLHFADHKDKYWPFVFPALILGSCGAMFTYTHTNIAVFANTPPSMAGVVGAVFNCALQLGGAVGISAVTSIESSQEKKTPNGYYEYEGRRSGMWYIFALAGALFFTVLFFYREKGQPQTPDAGELPVQEKPSAEVAGEKAV